MSRIEALLSARLFLVPQLVGERLFFISNLSGHMSLYAMNYGGSVPEPLIPPQIALQNPKLLMGESFSVFPHLEKIMLAMDENGDEAYKPSMIPLNGGFPEPLWADEFTDYNVNFFTLEREKGIVVFLGQHQKESKFTSWLGNLNEGTLTFISEGMYGNFPTASTADYKTFILVEQFGASDTVLYTYTLGDDDRKLFFGTPPSERKPGEQVPPSGIFGGEFVQDDTALVVTTIMFDECRGLAYLPLDNPAEIRPITITGLKHSGIGEMESFDKIEAGENTYLATYNIDGCSWVYEGTLDINNLTFNCDRVLVGEGYLSNGVLEAIKHEKESNRYALVFSTATSPTQIYTLEGDNRDEMVIHTNERILGIPNEKLSAGEDYSYDSHDGLRISARLYLPAETTGHQGPFPLVYYLHGGPQSQERPDFAWFSMPLIQQLTLLGFAVFVPNVRGSTGYGFSYSARVMRDWGGQDRLDHVHAMTEVLAKDPRIDISRAGVTGRSYGGYMTLTLAARHPELWKAAVDMFGPYDLTNFTERVPETWKPMMKFMVGDPETEQEMLLERSPRTYLDNINMPLLVIQGKNDPRVWEIESRELVEEMQEKGKQVEYLMFEDEGHDVLKFENRVTCYNAITDYFAKYL